ncbi:MAG: acyl-CoA thioesterase [Clostridiales bacterium]|nr:acyl-CoA thioesterase [Clostridiales bacterium]
MKDYLHKVQYHETDKMGITHHSNYVKWMEEARIDFLDQIGFGYAKLEADGIVSPVIGLECKYKHSTTFDDTVRIRVWVEEFKGVKLVIGYTMELEPAAGDAQEPGEFVCEARSEHCFLSKDGRPVILKKQFPELDRALRELAENYRAMR